MTSARGAVIEAGELPERLHHVLDTAIGLIPLGRPGEVTDVAAAVAFLATEDAGFTTGQVISVNGAGSML
ncbi:MAG: SDR family oxidoreductase [Pseudonocardiaceae bacterium]|nr:SDR family oxidoreductase [Pseudonocardiaceae bacterium]